MNPESLNLSKVLDPVVYPQKLAFIGLDENLNETRYSFAKLDQLTNNIAGSLLDRGYSQGDRIAILAANSVEYIAVVLAAMRVGLVAVPVNYRLPLELIHYVIKDSGARLVFCDQPRISMVPNDIGHLRIEPDAVDGLPWLTTNSRHIDTFQPAEDDPAMMLYTSGSTGKPKGVVLSHAAHLWVVKTRLKTTSLTNEHALIAAPLYHMNALALVLLSLASGATSILLPRFEAKKYLQAIERYQCTWLTAVPPMIAMMLREEINERDLSSVRVIRMGSAPVSSSLLQQIHHLLPNARVINAYGTTEGGPVVFGSHPQGIPTPPLAIGYPHPEVEIRLRDNEGRESNEGVLELKSPGLMTGYYHRPDLGTPFTADGYYVTGDVFRRDEQGFYTFIGRRDDMFVSGGENIYPGEVEKVLERHPAVQQACVIPVEDEIKGYKPVAFVVLKPGYQTDDAELKKFSLEHSAVYEHPRKIWIVDALPLAGTNKIDRNCLHKLAEQMWKKK